MFLCSFLLKSSLLQQTNFKKFKKEIKVWIVQCGQYVAMYIWLVLKCNTVVYFAVFVTLFGKMNYSEMIKLIKVQLLSTKKTLNCSN